MRQNLGLAGCRRLNSTVQLRIREQIRYYRLGIARGRIKCCDELQCTVLGGILNILPGFANSALANETTFHSASSILIITTPFIKFGWSLIHSVALMTSIEQNIVFSSMEKKIAVTVYRYESGNFVVLLWRMRNVG